MEEQLLELFSFVTDARPDVRQLAANNIAGLSTTAEFFPFLKLNDSKVVRDLMRLVKGEPMAAHDALTTLINLCVDRDFVAVMDQEEFLFDLILLIVLPQNVLADLCCMLLNNLSESSSIAGKLVADIARAAATAARSPQSTTPTTTASTSTVPPATGTPQPAQQPHQTTHYLDNLLEVYIRGEAKKYNPSATYDFLGGVLANVAMTTAGAHWFRGRTNVDNTIRLSKMVVFCSHPNRIRRSAAFSTLKNVAFESDCHVTLLEDQELNLLPYVLLPLSGPEEYTDEEMDGMPDELQLLEDDKEREPDAKLRLMIVEILLLLTTTRRGREILRAKKVYPVVQKLHLQEKDDLVQDCIERLVQMLCGTEEGEEEEEVPEKGRRIELPASKKQKIAEDDFAIEEVVDSDDEEEDMQMGALI
ncbi:hypothetical protein HKX48_002706 [Thoreauomyces humboldtii]|nr:hypothetical protein HKX48_002706 [Thoreauomyces humboldtii]